MPEWGNYPEPTEEQLAWMHKSKPIMADGSAQVGLFGVVVVSCVDSRPNWRKLEAQFVDDAVRRLYHPEFVEEILQVFRFRDAQGNFSINHKAMNIWRYKFIRPYKFTEAGGRFAQGPASLYVTAKMHGVTIESVCLTQHDDCSAASGPTGGNRIDWDLAIQLTIHDLWRYNIGPQVRILTGNIKTDGTHRENVRDAMLFEWDEYNKLVPFEEAYEVVLPSDDCNTASVASLRALPSHHRSCLIFEDYQLRSLVKYQRYLNKVS